jgi:eukaryotic-like serine/threonine-protein kinase
MEQPGRYRFTHALMQETLLSELSTTRRVRLHGQVGEALEKRWGDRADERASRLAEHFVEASTLAPRYAEKAVHYAKLAAEQAEAQTAWDDAVNWYQRCLALLTGSADDPLVDKAELLTALGMAQRDAGLTADQTAEPLETFTQAKALYLARNDAIGFARVTVEAVMGRDERAAERWPIVSEALTMLGDQAPELEARLLAHSLKGDWSERAEARAARAWELADLYQLHDVKAIILGRRGARLYLDHRLAEGSAAYREAAAEWRKADRRGGTATAAFFLQWSVIAVHSDLDRAIVSLQEPLDEARRTHERLAEYIVFNTLLAFHRSRGESEEAVRLLEAMRFPTLQTYVEASWAECGGDLERAQATIGPGSYYGTQSVANLPGAYARIALHRGDREAARGYFDEFMRALELPEEEANTRFYGIDAADDAIAEFASEPELRFVYDFLALGPDLRRTWLTIWGLDHIRGDIARKLERPAEAEAHYQTGLAWAERERCFLEAARCLQGLAEVAADRGDVTVALQFLDRAAAHLRPHGAKFYLDQVIARKVALQGVTSEDSRSSIVALNIAVQSDHPDLRRQTAPDGTVTLLFSDIENSTPLNERLGDEKYMELLRAHNAVIDAEVKKHRGYVVKTMGDGYMIAFKSAAEGLRCAIAIQQAMTGHDLIRVRIGLHTGEMLREGDDFFGRHVNLAARVASGASGGEVLTSDVVHELVAGQGFDFADRGERSLKGFDDLQRVWVLRWQT